MVTWEAHGPQVNARHLRACLPGCGHCHEHQLDCCSEGLIPRFGCLGLRVKGLGFRLPRVWGLGCRVVASDDWGT